MASNLYAKLVDGQPVTTCAAEEDTDLIAQLIADGFKPYDDSAEPPSGPLIPKQPTIEPTPVLLIPGVSAAEQGATTLTGKTSAKSDGVVLQEVSGKMSGTAQKLAEPSLSEAVPAYRDDGDRIVLEWEIVPNSPTKIAAEIARLQSELAATDYQVIKSYEYTLAKQKQPYDITGLHAERQTLRDRIAELEGLL